MACVESGVISGSGQSTVAGLTQFAGSPPPCRPPRQRASRPRVPSPRSSRPGRRRRVLSLIELGDGQSPAIHASIPRSTGASRRRVAFRVNRSSLPGGPRHAGVTVQGPSRTRQRLTSNRLEWLQSAARSDAGESLISERSIGTRSVATHRRVLKRMGWWSGHESQAVPCVAQVAAPGVVGSRQRFAVLNHRRTVGACPAVASVSSGEVFARYSPDPDQSPAFP